MPKTYMTNTYTYKKEMILTLFGDTYLKLKDINYNDDRALYVSLYESVMESIEEMKKVKSIMIKRAFTTEYHKTIDELIAMEKRFKENGLL